MSIHLFQVAHPSQSATSQVRLLIAYENGGLVLWERLVKAQTVTVGGEGWTSLWQVKAHNEAGMLNEIGFACCWRDCLWELDGLFLPL